ncbi:efflux RND transporter periplasmic adaptor subunit [Stieleria varia]|uniref:Macrolide transporter subunit MacA n=1 Tax=Stieleria varia TaxID=2528005 RepID=A0A5C6B5D8_9BACT|nr:efflux RND transporter periplasmic adaptor subunit [Stieleria varia]TWU06486.1 macrolide transporter subunit MacA [Stieleria varia]
MDASTQSIPLKQQSERGKRESESLSRIVHLIEAVAKSESQREAIAAMVTVLSESVPGCSVRCGVGAGKLRHYYDLRLGWLGEESPLRQMASEQWSMPRDSSALGNELDLEISQVNGDQRCVIWVKGENDSVPLRLPEQLLWVTPLKATLGHLIWSRQASRLRRVIDWFVAAGWNTRVAITIGVLMLILVAVWPVSYRVQCSAIVTPQESRLVSVPFAATLLKTEVQPGDAVQAGQILLVLDGRPLRLELESIEAQIDQSRKDHDIALAGGRIAEAQQARLKQRELSRRADLIVDRLENLDVTSPIDGVVIAGDMQQSIGSPLETGQSLFEIAPLDTMLVEIEIPEHDISYVHEDTDARIRLTALGNQTFHASLDQLYPAATVREDANVFIGRASLTNPDGQLRPGMRGHAVAYGPLRPWLWSYLRGTWERTLWWIGF